MKNLMALVLSVACLLLCSLAMAETDYSYLQDMSVKELRELRNEINKLLGDDGTAGSSKEVSFPEKDDNGYEVSTSEYHYKIAIDAVKTVKRKVNNPSSFEVMRVGYSKSTNGDNDIYVYYSATNGFGARLDDVYDCEYSDSGSFIKGFSWRSDMEMPSMIGTVSGIGEELLLDFITANIK